MSAADWFSLGVLVWGVAIIIAVRFIARKIDEIDEADEADL